MGIDAELDAKEQLVRAWMLLADGKSAAAARIFTTLPDMFWARFGLAELQELPAEGARGFAEAELLLTDEPVTSRAPAIARRASCVAASGEPEYGGYMCDDALSKVDDEIAVLWLTCAGAQVWPRRRRVAGARQALSIAGALDFRKAADTYHQLAATLRRSGHLIEAGGALDRAVELLARTRLHSGLATCHLIRAEELAGQGAIAEAIDHAQRARVLSSHDQLAGLCLLADLHRRVKRFDAANHYAQQALVLAFTPSQLGLVRRVLALIAGDSAPETAEQLFRDSAAAFARSSDALEMAETLRLLGLHLSAQGRLAEAVSCFDQACATVLAPRPVTAG